MTQSMRSESDSMGTVAVPTDAYYGAQTARALANFRLSGRCLPPRFIKALGLVKLAAARVNMALGLLDSRRGVAIEQAASEVSAGAFVAEFPIDVFQSGSGTSTNMNANEVIANRANEILGGARGDHALVHPNDHVNMAQSTNDVFPTALHIAALQEIDGELLPALRRLAEAFDRQADKCSDVVKAGRTHLQDAVPMTLGQEFGGYASVVRHGVERIEGVMPHLAELAIGGTAVGTGLTAHPEFRGRAVSELCQVTGLRLLAAPDAFEALQTRDAAVSASGACRTVAVGLMKIANDLRLLSSGPRTGLAEIHLPDLQPGSSIMPGKVNPVIPEVVTMVAAQVIGHDAAIAVAGLNGTLELNAMMPIIAYDLLDSLSLLGAAATTLADRCVDGIQPDRERCRYYALQSPAVVTALAPLIGYDAAAAIVKQALEQRLPVADVLQASGLVPEGRIDSVLDLLPLTRGGRASM